MRKTAKVSTKFSHSRINRYISMRVKPYAYVAHKVCNIIAAYGVTSDLTAGGGVNMIRYPLR